MRESVKSEINKRELNNQVGYVQKRISNIIKFEDLEQDHH